MSDPIVRRFISARGTDAFWPGAKASLERAREPFAEGFNWSLEFAEQLRKAKETGDHRKLLGETLRSGVKLCSDTTSRAFNYAAPVGGIAVLLLTIAVYSILPLPSVDVSTDSLFMVYVTDESEFIAAKSEDARAYCV